MWPHLPPLLCSETNSRRHLVFLLCFSVRERAAKSRKLEQWLGIVSPVFACSKPFSCYPIQTRTGVGSMTLASAGRA